MARSYGGALTGDIYIANQALDLIHALNINTIGAGLTMEEEQRVANIYEDVRDALLRRFRWVFAIQQCTILNSASSYAGAYVPFAYSYISDLPSDCLRVLEVMNYTGEWRVYANNKLLVDVDTNTDDLEIKYIQQVTDPSLFDACFREIFILKLAQKLAKAIGDKKGDWGDLLSEEKIKIVEAMRLSAFEDQERVEEDTDKIEEEDSWVKAGR